MASFENDRFKCKFDVPDRPTVRQQMAWYSHVSKSTDDDQFFRWWEGARTVITNWECESVPDINVNIDELTDPTQAQVMIWAGIQVLGHMNRLEDLPKNS